MPDRPHFFRDSQMTHEQPDAPRTGYADLASIGLNESMSEAEFRRRLSAATGISESDGASLSAAIYALMACGALRSRRVGTQRTYRLVRRYGPIAHQNSFRTVDDFEEGDGGDTAYRRAKQAERRVQDERTRQIVDERLRQHGLIS